MTAPFLFGTNSQLVHTTQPPLCWPLLSAQHPRVGSGRHTGQYESRSVLWDSVNFHLANLTGSAVSLLLSQFSHFCVVGREILEGLMMYSEEADTGIQESTCRIQGRSIFLKRITNDFHKYSESGAPAIQDAAFPNNYQCSSQYSPGRKDHLPFVLAIGTSLGLHPREASQWGTAGGWFQLVWG